MSNLNASPTIGWHALSERITEILGLDFPSNRWSDLRRAVAALADDLGATTLEGCIECLLSEPLNQSQWLQLASYLTVGETYFFRDRQTFTALSSQVLPELIDSRRGARRKLRFWSAGCCTGEEAYSLAIVLREALANQTDWDVRVIGTDVNPRYLRSAQAGVYRDWSFRGMAPTRKQRYFTRQYDGRYVLREDLRDLVDFRVLNLIADAGLSQSVGDEMDLIVCQNVLMYFTPEQARRAVLRLQSALGEGGWLVVSPIESCQPWFSDFACCQINGRVLFRKGRNKHFALPAALTRESGPALNALPVPPGSTLAHVLGPRGGSPSTSTLTEERKLRHRAEPLDPPPYQGANEPQRDAEASRESGSERPAQNARRSSRLARAYAERGQTREARAWCERWLRDDMLDPAAHYVYGLTLLQLDQPRAARDAFQRVLYLAPDHAMAHVMLGATARDAGDPARQRHHAACALELLAQKSPAEIVPESDGLSVAALVDAVRLMTLEVESQ